MTPRPTPVMVPVVTLPRYDTDSHDRALAHVSATKSEAERARAALEKAEREHHEAILEAAAVPGLTVSAIARAAGVSRTRIYKRFAQPVYGERSPDAPTYGERPATAAS